MFTHQKALDPLNSALQDHLAHKAHRSKLYGQGKKRDKVKKVLERELKSVQVKV